VNNPSGYPLYVLKIKGMSLSQAVNGKSILDLWDAVRDGGTIRRIYQLGKSNGERILMAIGMWRRVTVQ
jgi:hypothetical protein